MALGRRETHNYERDLEPTMNPENLMQQVRETINAGLLTEAISMAKSRTTRDTLDCDLHLAWADILEDLDLTDEVIQELNLAIRDDPDRTDTYTRLAEVYLDQGHPNRAARVWSELILRKPDEPRFYEELGSALRDTKQFEKAQQIYQTALEKTGDARFKGFLRELKFLESTEAESRETPEGSDQVVPQRHHLVTFTTLFSSREGVYARQWVSPTGESGYTPVQEPLTLNVAENHILGNYTIGAYPVRLDNTVNYIAFDFDIAKFAVASAIASERTWNSLVGRIHKLACRLVDIGAAHDVAVYIEDSGFKGRHCWIFPETPIPAGVAKKFGELMRNQLAPIPQDMTVEVFPKQTSVRKGGLGNLIKLPLGVHKRTGKRAVFLQPDSTPYPDQLGFMENISKTPRRMIYAYIQRMQAGQAPQPQEFPQPGGTRQHESPFEESLPFEISERPAAKIEIPFDLDRDPEFQTLMLKCPVLRNIVDKVNRTGSVSKEETLILIHSLGHLNHGPEAVNAIFLRCDNADPTLFLKSRLKGNPVSCPKIRSRIPDLTSTVSCNCSFDLDLNLYPTPLIHVRAFSGTETPSPLGLTVDSIQFQTLVQDYIKLRKQFRETKLLMERYEARLNSFFEDAAVESVQTPLGELRRMKKEGSPASFTLEI
ncbi:MAG: CRISPR-associated primase-polymerase type A1 [Deltaproteobacteria bacterium]|nr:CRISPR-associated primase-polymerase type A1 [Deltaproteobacteria bacterium]